MNVRAHTASRPDVVRSGGTVSERYRSLFEIGKGGMGSIEVALERGGGGFQRIVALKRMLPESTRDARHTEMFLREARLAALLTHPNVVHAFAFGESEGELFLAMEYVEGEPLSNVLRVARERAPGAMSPEIVAYVLAEVCEGLHAAHELRDLNGAPLNVIHRDVSPHNVMVAYDGQVKLLDFGVAKMETKAEKALTRTGEVKGKTGYMSPEQAMGDPLDRRSDLFSVGAVLFECLAGRKMWGNGTDMEVLRRLALEDPPRLDVAAPDAPRALCDLHARLVARAPAARPDTARAVAEQLRAWLASRGRTEGGTVASLMTRIFAEEAAARRRALNDALREAAPAEVEVLRQSLTSGSLRPPSQRTTAFEAAGVPPSEAPHPTRRGIVISALVGLVMAIAIAGIMAARAHEEAPPRNEATPAQSAPTSAAVATPSAAPVPTASAAPSVTAIAPSAPSAAPHPPVRPVPRGSRPHPKPAGSANGKVDVDPEPF